MPALQDPLVPVLVPVLVDAMGRSGTTAMMRLLASSPAVVCGREHPYEERYLTYLYSWAGLLDGDERRAGKWPRGKMLSAQVDEIGGLPWRGILPDVPEFAAKCFRSAWGHFSAGAGDGSTHYIEKVSRWIGDALPTVLPTTRVIYLVRDPRDVWLSTAAFNNERGFLGFGRKAGQGDDEFFSQFVARVRRRLEPLVGRDFGEGQTLIRYEDFVTDTGAVAAQLGDWLGLSFDPAVVEVSVAGHVTSGSPAGSVGRWRKEMPRQLARRFESELGDILAAFGYR